MNRFTAVALAVLAALPCVARAQEDKPGDADEMKAKIIEIERLMKGAEQALASSTDTRSAAEKSAEAARKILDQKAKQETGKSSDQLRQEAAAGSKEAGETLERLTKSANQEAKDAAEKMAKLLGGSGSGGEPNGGAGGGSAGAGEGVRKLIEKMKGDGQGASQGIKWILEKAKSSGQSPNGGSGNKGGGGGSPESKQPNAPDPPKPEQDKPNNDHRKPESKTEPPRSPEFEQWYAELPPQVRKAYDSQDWESIPPKWRDMLKAWSKKMADGELDKERR